MTTTMLSESHWPADMSRPILDMAIGTALAKAARDAGERIALVEVLPAAMPSPVGQPDTNRTWTCAQLFEDALRCASWLLTQFKTGDRICVWAPNAPEWIILQYGAALSGMILVTANPALKASELEFVLAQSQSVALFHLDAFRGVEMAAVAESVLRPSVTGISFTGWLPIIRVTDMSTFPDISPDLPAQIQYTSGTTGRPKGALLHHRGLITNASYVAARVGLDRSVLISPMPLFHTAGSIMSVLGCLNSRSTLILPLMFEPNTVLDAIQNHRAQIIFGVPTMLLALIDAQATSARDLFSLRAALSGCNRQSPF